MEESKKLKLYLLILNRYKELINEKETRTIGEIKERIKPHHPFIENMKSSLIPKDYKCDFAVVLSKLLSFMSRIETVELAINFWFEFEEIVEIEAADAANKAILFVSLLRSLGSDSAKVIITKSGEYYASFVHSGKTHLFSPKTNSLLVDEDALRVLSSDPPRHVFNDVEYENLE